RMRKQSKQKTRFRRARLFRFASNSAACCSKSVNQRKHSENSKPRSKSILDGSEYYMERREPPSKTATRKMQAAITRSSPHKRQTLPAREMNLIKSANFWAQ